MSDFRAYFHPENSNPEVEGSFYELASYEEIYGFSNCEILTLGFTRGEFIDKLRLKPIDSEKPIVFAIRDLHSGCDFIVIDDHTKASLAGMKNMKPFKTNDYLIDCSADSVIRKQPRYWSVVTEGNTFVHGENDFPDVCVVEDLDKLCDFISGCITANELRAYSYLSVREEEKEVRREEHIRSLSLDLASAVAQISAVSRDRKKMSLAYLSLSQDLKDLIDPVQFFVMKSKLGALIGSTDK